MDKSYIHQHYKKDANSIWDPNNKQDIQIGKLPNKGNCYCFLCAIEGPNPLAFQYSKDEHIGNGRLNDKLLLKEITTAANRGGVVDGSVWTFCPQQKKDQKGDYHKVFNSTNYLQWWTNQLLPNLTQPSLIIMDNAKYHCTYPANVPKLSKKKGILTAFLQSRNVAVEPTNTVTIIKEKIRMQRKNEKMQCEILAEALGHKVLFTPPYHSDLQPIELLWAKLKGNIGRKYKANTTMTVLKQQLDNEFLAALHWHESIEGMIHWTSQISLKLYTNIQHGEVEVDDALVVNNAYDGSSESGGSDESR